MTRTAGIFAAALALAVTLSVSAQAATLVPLGDDQSAFDFTRPTFVTSDPNDPDRRFVVEQPGRVQEVAGGKVTLFADLTDLVDDTENEQGLLSIAPAPDFAATERFYAAYTGSLAAGDAVGEIHVDGFVPSGVDGGVTREPMLEIPHPTETNHNGGQLQFGPDGHLYVSTGDGGGTGDPFENAQNLDSLLGKLLRIDPVPEPEAGDPAYTVPLDNPFAGIVGARSEIWAYGLRNPWRFSFDRSTGDLLIGDVGQGLREEVDYAAAPDIGRGANFGWNCWEGFSAYADPALACEGLDDPADFVKPVFDYPHDDPGGDTAHGCSITGGYMVRDPGLPELYGRYLYADYCAGELRTLAPGGQSVDDRSTGLNAPQPTSFGQDACGRLYVVSKGGAVLQLVGDQGPVCVASLPGPPEDGGGGPGPVTKALKALLSAKRLGKRVQLTVRVRPCAGAGEGLVVQLWSGGRQLRARPLPAKCVVKFRLSLKRRAGFRAIVVGSATGPARSKRLRVSPVPR
ncbi:MAG TPA: PQQ-dependent sugar dehydrogenase [Solirubrobacterales bacterium]